eukprot:CAMPEP_0180560482 /NCGR_PEP_ID=MMETSP1037_2-20121125/2857_1 /TAXON_ID=632150 /ORGANISM="Azadinium spinosum, Strain 3D9" /LENGTH=73 /DNA_ID=CAMNT_0022577031 /DNA_START=91 /DNA_END=313 /DNA_ORIENTATION=+
MSADLERHQRGTKSTVIWEILCMEQLLIDLLLGRRGHAGVITPVARNPFMRPEPRKRERGEGSWSPLPSIPQT